MSGQRSLVPGWAGGFLLTVWLAASAFAQAPGARDVRALGAPDEGDPRVEAELVTDVSRVAPGDPFRIGVRFRMDAGWHIYWRNPGESGLASEVDFRAGGAQLSAVRFPFPETLRTKDAFITTYGYGGEVLLFAEGRAPADAAGRLVLEADADVLVCEVNCIPAKLRLGRTLEVGRTTAVDPDLGAAFDSAAARVPQPWTGATPPLAAKREAASTGPEAPFLATLRVLEPGWVPGTDDFFVPDENEQFSVLKLLPAPAQGPRLSGMLSPTLVGTPQLRGVAHLRTASGQERFVELEVPLEQGPSAPSAAATPVEAGGGAGGVAGTGAPPSLAWVLLLAFAGGALLNLMPCVFPVLALKTYGFARLAQQDRRTVAVHALAYTAGVIGSMLLLALGVTAAKLGGESVGWGFQFQEPLFIAAVAAVVVAFAANLFGAFTVGFGATAVAARVDATHGLGRSAGEGALAVLLATPCSAPFLGTAVGFAFAAGTGTIFMVFAVLGLGLAAPFCALVLVPGMARWLPRPGAWMERLKQLLGFALLATAAWLLWVMGGLAGVEGMGRLGAFLVAVALGAWLYGVAQQAATRARRVAGMLLALGLLAGAGVVALDFEDADAGLPGQPVIALGADTQPWTEEAVQAALQEGRPVFVVFTADWCLTCKFNERTVLAADSVREAFRRHQVAYLVADWTRRDERIRQALAQHGRAGVPMYLAFSPERPEQAEVLPELLTPQLVVDAVARAAPTSPRRADKESNAP